METLCNSCNKTFESDNVKLKTKVINGDIHQVYFRCPVCGHKFIVALTSQRSRSLQSKIKALAGKANNENDINKLRRLVKEHKTLMDELNHKK